MQVADRWQAPRALSAIRGALCLLQPVEFPIAAVYSLPQGLQTSPAFVTITAKAETCLLAVFGDATIVAASRALVGRFVSLPHAAILALLHSKALVTDAEATMLLLFSEWCNADIGKACTETELQQLNACIRYSRLSTPYLSDTVLYKTLHTPTLTTEQRMEVLHFKTLLVASQSFRCKSNDMISPPSWYLAARSTPPRRPLGKVTFSLKVSEADLHKLIRHTKAKEEADSNQENLELRSTPTYAWGFWWTIELSGHYGKPWCGIFVRGVSDLSSEDTGVYVKHGILCDYDIVICGFTPAMHNTGQAHLINSNGIGCNFVAGKGETLAPSDVKWWATRTVNGFFTIAASVSNVQF